MSAVSPKEIKEALEKVNDMIMKNYDMDEITNAYAKLGIQIKNPDGSFKCWYDILKEVSEVWKTIEDN